MRSPQRRLRFDKRGLSGVVSGLFILVIALSMVIFIYETYQAQTQMSDWDAERVRERIEVSDVFFGETSQYSPSSVTPPSSQMASLEKLDDSYLQFNASKGDKVATPITNMNFTNGDTGWSFGKDPGAQLIESGHSSQLGNPAPGSGPGSIYVQMNGLSTGPYWMNWTYYFSYSQGLPKTTYFSWAKNVWDIHVVSSGTLYVVLTSPNGTLTIIRGPIDILSLTLESWYYESLELGSGIISSPGTYALTVAVWGATSSSGNPHDSGNLVVFFDDVGISTVLGKTYTTDFFGTFNTGKDPNYLRRIQVTYAGRYAPWSGSTSNAPTSMTMLGSTSIIGGSYQNLAIKDGSLVSLRSYVNSAPNGFNPSSYTLLGQTTLQAGNVGNLASDDGTYQSFTSYRNASDIYHFADDEMSNVDSSPSKGTHSDFTALQYGPDSVFDTLTEQNVGGIGGLSSVTATGSIPNDMATNMAGCMGAVFFNPTGNVYTVTRVEFNASGATNQVFNGIAQGAGTSYPTTGWVNDGGKKVSYWNGTLNVQPHTSQEFYVDIKGNKKAEVFNVVVRMTANSTVYSNSYTCEQLSSNTPWSVLWLGQGATPTFTVTASQSTQKTFYVSLEEDANLVQIQTGGILTILVPPEFASIISVGGTGWGTATITGNKIEVSNTQTLKNTYKTYAFNATTPSSPGLYMLNASFSGTPGTQTPMGNFSIQVTGSPSSRYELDLEAQWTDVDFGETNENLCIYAGALGNEDLNVQYWTGSSWSTITTDLTPNNWNNFSVTLSDPTFTIRFKGGNETSDTTQDSWQIDAALLHTWTDENIVEVELAGTNNTSIWASLNWTTNSAWTVSGVSVTIQLYDYSMAQYPTSGNGYINYTSGAPNTDETHSQAISSTASNFRNETGGWRIKIRGVKENATQFSLLCDWVEFKPSSYCYTTDWYGEFLVEDFALLEQVDISYWAYFNASTITQIMYIYNWNTSAYDQIGTIQTYPTAGVGQWHNCTTDSNLANYANSSLVRIRIFSGETSSNQFNCYADFHNIGVSGTVGGKTSVQKLYIMDYANDQWHLLASSNVAANDEMVGPVEISESISSYVDVQGTILVRVCSESETLVNCQANFMMIRLYSVNVSKITLEVTNLGSETVNLVRIYVVNSTGHSKIDLSTGMNVDRTTISPGEQALIQIDYPYSTCQYTFKVITKRGTIGAYVKTAS